MRRVLPVFLLLGACHPRIDIPEPENCSFPSKNATIRSIDIGWADPFTAYVDGDELRISTGGQGSPMIMMGVQVEGEDAPRCLAQRTVVRDDTGRNIGELDAPIKTYDKGDVRETDSFPIILHPTPSPGDALTIETKALGKTVTRSVYRYGGDSGDTGF